MAIKEDIGRNELCPCGSGKKFKKCCFGKKGGIKSAASAKFRAHKTSIIYWVFPLIILVSIIAYSNSFEVPFVFDDGAHIVDNRGIQLDDFSPGRIERFKESTKEKGRAVAQVSFAFNYVMGRLDPWGYHLFNLIVHILTAFGVYLLIETTLIIHGLRAGPDESFWGVKYTEIAHQAAAGASLIFAVHTINTQAVTYVVQRMTSMCALFFIFSMLTYIKGRQTHKAPRTLWYILSFILGLLAIGSKQNAFTLPFFIILYEIYFFQDIDWGKLREKWGIFTGTLAAVIGIPLLGAMYSTKINLFKYVFIEGYKTRPFTMGQRMLTQFRVVIYYISLLFYPHPSRLNLDYEFPLSYSFFNPITTLICFLIIAGLIVLAIYLRKRRPLISFFIIWFFGNLVIESTIYPLDLVYEHRLYLPSPAFLALFSMFVIIGVNRLTSSKIAGNFIKSSGLALVMAILIIWTRQRNYVWRSVVSILEDVCAKSPHNSRQHVNLGVAYSSLNMLDKAIEKYKKGIELDPNYPETYNNLANAYNRKGMLDEAIDEYAKAIKMRYDYKEAHNNLGSAYYKKGMFDEAVKEHLIALNLEPECEKSLNNLGVAYSAKGMYDEAVSAFKKAIASKPDFSKPYINLALTYTVIGKPNEAIDYLNTALMYDPANASIYYNLGNAYSDMGDKEKALAAFQQAVRMTPDSAIAYNNLGLAYRQLKEDEKAIEAYQQAMRLNPNQPEFPYNLGLLYAQNKEFDKGIPFLQRSVQLEPNLVRGHYDLAVCLESVGKYQEAALEYETAIKIDPAHFQACQNLANLYLTRFNDQNKARYYMQRAGQAMSGQNGGNSL